MLRMHFDQEALETYILGRMGQPDVDEFEEHVLLCTQCQGDLERESELVNAIQIALQIMPD